MTDVRRVCQSSHPSALQSLIALASICNDEKIEFGTIKSNSSDDDEKLIVEILVKTSNPFNNSQGEYSIRGLSGCARDICKRVPESCLWGENGSAGEDEGKLESWIESAVSTLGNVAYAISDDRVKDPQFASIVTKFADSIERHLLSTSNTFLVGDFANASDVVVCILLATASSRCKDVTICQETHRLVSTILNNPAIIKCCGKGIPEVPKLDENRKVELPKKDKPVEKPKDEGKKKKKKNASAPEEKKTDSVAPKQAAAVAPASNGDVPAYPDLDPSEQTDNPILSKLKSLSIPNSTYSHKLSHTVDELLSNVPLPPKQSHTKNLLLKDKKHGMFLVTTLPDADTGNTKNIGKLLNLEGKINLRFADGETLDKTLGAKPGCVGPMSILNDTENKVTLVLDERMMDLEAVHTHPLRNDASTSMKPSDLVKFCTEAGHEPVMIKIDSKSNAAPPAAAAAPKQQPEKGKNKPKQAKKDPSAPKTVNKDKKTAKKGDTLLALQWKKSENFPMWYSDVIVLSEMISYYDISGCYILRPWSFKIWELIQEWFNCQIRALDVDNTYFPLFVSQDRLEKEKDHVEGFAPEVAWVTKSGDGTLAKPIAVRPTSETIMYPAFSDWIKSHRDLPLKVNQWSNIVRWEFKDPTPFLRSREFLWQEGHTAHATYEESDVMVHQALDLYRAVYEDLLAVPVVKGFKTEKEKFAGGYQTTTVEAYIPMSGRAIQGATSHNLGKNFGEMFDIRFQNEAGESAIPWQTSWGLTTRTIGVMVMVHGDDQGLVLPPKISPLQCVIVPITSKKLPVEKSNPYCHEILKQLQAAGIRAKYDDREMYNPGWKYNHWEQKGVPIRLEVGPRDIDNNQVRMVVRYNSEKSDIAVDGIGPLLVDKLEAIQKAMFAKALEERDSHLAKITEWKDFVPNLEKNNLVLTPWIGGEHQDWEEWVKNKSREESLAVGEEEEATCATSVAAKTLCIPFDQPEMPEGTKCIASGEPATCWILWGRSY
eukprot:CAMPEP_0195526312 /NCGR_PEP_ID=MMETSP0794_2-20130614/27298_1 /TAXON_ID=515487 /ORGANISM="Stephanopyxis turris, Strain CCMP 815" /LENGTH=995 /DNA_ID=CAMNT_0040656967 /DNA_START=191 /DNA_END=3178 /DNA_ORIENTATION=+